MAFDWKSPETETVARNGRAWLAEALSPHYGRYNPEIDANNDAYTNPQLTGDTEIHVLEPNAARSLSRVRLNPVVVLAVFAFLACLLTLLIILARS